jgi:UPF0042 nucleotide-binding protein
VTSNIDIMIITGLSGAGKTEAVRSFEDMGFFCVDNLPPTLMPKFAELCAQTDGRINKIAMVVDIRGGEFFESIFTTLETLERMGFTYAILFLEASDDVLVRRFKETRRRHPLSPEGGILDGIRAERRRLEELRGSATKIIDTSALTARELRNELIKYYDDTDGKPRLITTVVSFGFKYGIPMDADMVIDVRFLPNPHYVDSLRLSTGDDPQVKEYIMKWPISRHFLEELLGFIDFLLPNYEKEGRAHLAIAIGCTGGRHRSVAIANEVGAFLREKGFKTVVEHRDIEGRKEGNL